MTKRKLTQCITHQTPYQQHSSYPSSPHQHSPSQPQLPSQQYPPHPGSFIPQRPVQQPGLWTRYRSASKSVQWAIGCGSLLLVFLVCSVCSSISTALTAQHPQTVQASGTPTAQTQTPAATHTELPLTPTPTEEPSPPVRQSPTPLPTQPPTPTLVPTPPPTPTPPPASTPTSLARIGVNGNPWGYTFEQEQYITNPPADFRSGQYFSCISSFEHGTGSVVRCDDGLYSKSGGQKGSCSKHGGEQAILYSHSPHGLAGSPCLPLNKKRCTTGVDGVCWPV
jgi:hypothetical protein